MMVATCSYVVSLRVDTVPSLTEIQTLAEHARTKAFNFDAFGFREPDLCVEVLDEDPLSDDQHCLVGQLHFQLNSIWKSTGKAIEFSVVEKPASEPMMKFFASLNTAAVC